VAYVVGEAETDALRAALRASLPEYMVPGAFVRLESLPKTATGKIDPRTLPAPEYAPDAAAYVAPRTAAEQALADIWADDRNPSERILVAGLDIGRLLTLRVTAKDNSQLRKDTRNKEILAAYAIWEQPLLEIAIRMQVGIQRVKQIVTRTHRGSLSYSAYFRNAKKTDGGTNPEDTATSHLRAGDGIKTRRVQVRPHKNTSES